MAYMLAKPKRILAMVLCGCVIAVAFYVLAFGAAMLCCAPVRLGAAFWRMEKFVWGLLPILISGTGVVLTWRLWVRTFVHRRNARLAGCLVVIVVCAIDLIFFLKYRGRQDEAIRLVWNGDSGLFSWGKGEVRVPVGFGYKSGSGIDTFVGYFTSPDGRLVIEHDIGELAGEHGGMGTSERLTAGSRIRLSRAVHTDEKGNVGYSFKVSFPDSGCANFSAESTKEADGAIIESIAESFRPTDWRPSWLRPLLPEALRSDCRYRFQTPGT